MERASVHLQRTPPKISPPERTRAGTRLALVCHATAGAEVSEDIPGSREPPELQACGGGAVRHTVGGQSPDQGTGGAAWRRAVRARTAVARAHRSRTQLPA